MHDYLDLLGLKDILLFIMFVITYCEKDFIAIALLCGLFRFRRMSIEHGEVSQVKYISERESPKIELE